MRVRLEMPEASALIRKMGLDQNGHVQMFHTQNVCRRIKRYMPMQSSMLTKSTYVKSATEIEVVAPYAKYMYYGKVMIDPAINAAGFMTPNGWRSRKGAIKVVTDRDLVYDTTKNPQAGPYWDRALIANEKDALLSDLQTYIGRST